MLCSQHPCKVVLFIVHRGERHREEGEVSNVTGLNTEVGLERRSGCFKPLILAELRELRRGRGWGT